MAQLGNIENTYGKDFIIATTNADSKALLSTDDLPSNFLIVSAPYDTIRNADYTYHTLFATDSNGQPIRLTYSLIPGNGLTVNGDTMQLLLDSHTLDSSSGISVNSSSFIDNTNLILENNKISVNADNLDKASEDIAGVAKIDGDTIQIIDGQLYVETTNLGKSDSSVNLPGTVISGNDSIVVKNGTVTLYEDSLPKASIDEAGVIKVNGTSIRSNNGVLTVSTKNLSRAEGSAFGTVTTDQRTIIATNGVVCANTNALTRATYTSAGIIKTDASTIVNNNGSISIKDYDNLTYQITYLYNFLSNIKYYTQQNTAAKSYS